VSGSVALVGAGPGDPGLLTIKAARLIAAADTLLYDALVSPPIRALASPSCELIDVGKRAGDHTLPQEEITALLVRLARGGGRIVRLKGGDPFVFGRGSEEAQALHAAGIPFQIVPGISSALAAPAYAGIPVTDRTCNSSFTVATGHEDPRKAASTLDWSRLADGNGMAIFLMAMGNLEAIATELQRHGKAPETPAAIIHAGTTPRQVTLTATLATVAEQARRDGVGAPAILVVGEGVRLREKLRWFDTYALFGKRVLITRPPSERDELAELLWECGAEPVAIPAILYGPTSEPEALREAVAGLEQGRYDWLMLSSRHGVERLFEALRDAGRDARAIGETRIAVVGERTAATLAGFGIRADLIPDRFTARDATNALLERLGDPSAQEQQPSRILLWAAEGASDESAQRLRNVGHHVYRVAAYTTRSAASPELAEGAASCEIWTFASASAIDGFLEAVPDAPKLRKGRRIVCLGPVTFAAAEAHGLAPDAVAERATVAGLLDALKALPC
jgi:uroporphyrinogen III methyltransferase/synthase